MGNSEPVKPVGPGSPPGPTPVPVPGPAEESAIRPAEKIKIGKHRVPSAKELTAGKPVSEPSGEMTVAKVGENFNDIIGEVLKKLGTEFTSIEKDAEAAESMAEVSSDLYERVLEGIDEEFMRELAQKLTKTDEAIKKAELEHLSALQSVYGKAAGVKESVVSPVQEVIGPPAQVLNLAFFSANALKKTLPLLEDGGLRDMLVFDLLLDKVTVDSAGGIAMGALLAEKPLAAVEFLRHGAVGVFLVFQATRLAAIGKQLNVIKEKCKENPDPEVEQQIKVLEKFLADQDEILKNTAMGYMVTTAVYVPKAYYFADWVSTLSNFVISDPVALGFGYANAFVRLPLQAYILAQSERKWEEVKKGVTQVTDRLYIDPTREEFNEFVVKTLKKTNFSEIIKDFKEKGIDFGELKTSKKTVFGKISKTVKEPKTHKDVEEILSNKTLRKDMFSQYKAKRLKEEYGVLIEQIFKGKTFEKAKEEFEGAFGRKLEDVLHSLDLTKEEALTKEGVALEGISSEEMPIDYYFNLFTKNEEVRKQFFQLIFPLHVTKQNAERLLAKRKARFEERVSAEGKKGSEFRTILDSFQTMTAEERKEKGLRFDRVTVAKGLTPESRDADRNLAELDDTTIERLLSDEKVGESLKKELLRQYVQHKETITALRKSGLKSVFNKKVEVEKSFLKFDVKTRRVVFAITFVATALTFVAFAILGTVFPPLGIGVLFTYLGLVIFTMSVGVLIAGHVHLRCKKPNVAKVSNYLKRAKISAYKIPLAIRSWMLERRRAELMMNSSQIMAFYSAKLGEINNILKGKEEIFEGVQLPGLEGVTDKKQIRGRIEELQQEAEKKFVELSEKRKQIDEKILFWSKKVTSIETRIKLHRDVLDEEGFREFAKTSRLETKELNLTSTIVDAFLDPEFHADPEMIDFFQTAGFDLEGIKSEVDKIVDENSRKDAKKEVRKKVLGLFGAMADDLMGKISKHEAQFNLLKKICAISIEGGDGGE